MREAWTVSGTKKSRPPYERYGIPREQVEADHSAILEAGAKHFGRAIQEALSGMDLAIEPKSGWDHIGYEVSVMQLGMVGLWPEDVGNAELERECRRLSRNIEKSAQSVALLTRSQAVSVASIFTKTPIGDRLSALFITARQLEIIANYLKDDKLPSKWAASQMREVRLVLACKLTPLFEREFELPARPRGGSETLDIRSENEWTKFFQAIATLVIGDDAVTPDRQAILWEAARPSDLPAPDIL